VDRKAANRKLTVTFCRVAATSSRVGLMQMAAMASAHKAAERHVSLKSAFLLHRLCSLVDGMLELITVRFWRISIWRTAVLHPPDFADPMRGIFDLFPTGHPIG
jgi:hypothetical protein